MIGLRLLEREGRERQREIVIERETETKREREIVMERVQERRERERFTYHLISLSIGVSNSSALNRIASRILSIPFSNKSSTWKIFAI